MIIRQEFNLVVHKICETRLRDVLILNGKKNIFVLSSFYPERYFVLSICCLASLETGLEIMLLIFQSCNSYHHIQVL